NVSFSVFFKKKKSFLSSSMNTLVLSSNSSLGSSQTTKITVSRFDPQRIHAWIKSNPRQMVTVDILGDQIDLPVYALRRRNAIAYL
ncbi:hypothetical protein BD560DRAFT_390865, partial [Blakeslea trispora]